MIFLQFINPIENTISEVVKIDLVDELIVPFFSINYKSKGHDTQ